MKKTIAVLLAFCTVFSMLSLAAHAAEKVYALTMGVHRYAANSTVADGSDIAEVTYTRHATGETGSADRIYDVRAGETFTLETAVKAEMADYFMFIAWLDVNGEIIGREPTLELTMDSSKAAFATYAEIADRHVLTYTVVGEGTVSVSSDLKLKDGDGCVSVLHGARASVKFTPAKGYSASYIKVDGDRVSFLQNATAALGDAIRSGKIKSVFNALLNIVKYYIGKEAVYTIASVKSDMTFEVGFTKPYFQKEKR
ncbi:MAG: hypothetical protein IJT44_00500 [Clostridia bacterium]|nr:hypothetical protein [Clostridia bacterium]